MPTADAAISSSRRFCCVFSCLALITHHTAIEDLRASGANVADGARVVDDGDIVTAAGVTSGIDLALHLVERELGSEAAAAGAREIEWTQMSVASASGRSIGTNE